MANYAIPQHAALAALSLDELTKEFRRQFALNPGKIIARSKYLVAMESKLAEGKSLRSYMKDTFGEIDANAYKPARVFRELVALNADGSAQDKPGIGQILESHFDAILAPTIHIEASAVLGYIAKKYEGQPEEIVGQKETLAEILRNHKSDDETRKLIAAMKATVKPAAKEKGDGEGEEGEDKGKEKGQESAVATVTPLMLVDMLTGKAGLENWKAIMEHARATPGDALALAEKLQALADNARKANTVVLGFVPAPVEIAA